MQYQGRIENWDDEKGYGFVAPEAGGTRTFVHIKEFIARPRRPVDGDLIVYEMGFDQKNRPRAVNVRFQFDQNPSHFSDTTKRARSIGLGGFFALAFLCLLVILCALNMISVAILVLYVVMSVMTFLAYDLDKAAARNNRWRTRETSLQLLALVGGWPGALLGQKLFRHKTRKLAFQMFFWSMVFVNCGILALSLTEVGPGLLRTLAEEFDAEGSSILGDNSQPSRSPDKSGSTSKNPAGAEGIDQRLPIIRPLPRSTER